MAIRKQVVLFLVLIYAQLLASEFAKASTYQTLTICPGTDFVNTSKAAKASNETCSNIQMTNWIEKQIDGSANVCSDVLRSNFKDINWNQSQRSQSLCPRLIVWVEQKKFSEFVEVKDGEVKGGFSIAMFCLALQELQFKIQPIFVVSNETGGSYDLLAQRIKNKKCEAMAGDITITSTRTNHVDFTIPYMSSAIYTLVPATRKWNQTIVTLIRPFTVGLWLTIICASIFIGLAIGILEYRADNPEFKVHLCKKVTMIIWFPISTIFFHEGRIHNRNTKVVLVIWITTIFITVQIFTSSLSSWLTVNQLQPKVRKQNEKIGYQNGSCVENFAENQSPFTIKTLPLYNMNDYKNVLDNGTEEAIYEELPYIDMFIAKYGDMYQKDGPLADES